MDSDVFQFTKVILTLFFVLFSLPLPPLSLSPSYPLHLSPYCWLFTSRTCHDMLFVSNRLISLRVPLVWRKYHPDRFFPRTVCGTDSREEASLFTTNTSTPGSTVIYATYDMQFQFLLHQSYTVTLHFELPLGLVMGI